MNGSGRIVHAVLDLPEERTQDGRLLVRIDDVSLADSSAVEICRMELPIGKGDARNLAISMICPKLDPPPRTPVISARLLFHSGDSPERGDWITKIRYNLPSHDNKFELKLEPVG